MSAQPRSANRLRVKGLDKLVYINGEPVAGITQEGISKASIKYKINQEDRTDFTTAIEKRGDASFEDVEEGFPLYKTAEDDEGLYFLTSKPEGFSHESASPGEDDALYVCNVCGREFSTGAALGGHKNAHSEEERAEANGELDEPETDPREVEVDDTNPVRLSPNADLDDIEWGRMYDAEVNNRQSYGVFVSLPEAPPKEAVSVLVHKEKSELTRPDLLDKLKTANERKDGRGDRLLVAPKHRRVTDGKWTFTIVKALDTLANVQFDNEIPAEKVYVDEHNEPLDDPLIGERILGVADKPEPETERFAMSASPHDPQGERPSDALEAEAMQQTDTDETETPEETEAPTALQVAYDGRGTPAEEYRDAGEMADEAGATLSEVAEPSLNEHYASAETLAEYSSAFIQVLKQVSGDDAEAAHYIRWRLAQLDDEESREFIGVAAGSEIPDDVFRKIVRELT